MQAAGHSDFARNMAEIWYQTREIKKQNEVLLMKRNTGQGQAATRISREIWSKFGTKVAK